MNLVILDYGVGNIKSIQFAFDRLGVTAVLSNDIELIKAADKIIFPGVGEASSAMNKLKDTGLVDDIKKLKQPVLGICLGLQLMCKHSEEGDVNCLGIFDNKVKKFPDLEIVPHMGWNNFTTVKGMLMKHIEAQNDVYYVHNYFADLSDDTTAVCNYINPFSAVLEKDNFFATQFHPEKSADVGEQILKNFLKL